jgi:hypothetical protein
MLRAWGNSFIGETVGALPGLDLDLDLDQVGAPSTKNLKLRYGRHHMVLLTRVPPHVQCYAARSVI